MEDSARVRVAVVIVTYNSAAHVVAALRSIGPAASEPPQVIVVDNGSRDETTSLVPSTMPAATVIEAGANLGFARACNLGAAAIDAEYLLFLNPDSALDPGALDRAVDRLAADPGIGLVGGRTRYDDRTVNPTCCFARPTLWSAFCLAAGLSSIFRRSGLFNPEAMAGWDRDSDRYVDVVTGCFLLMRTDLFRSLGGFDERFFLYSEDTDLGARVRALGLKCIHLHDVGLVHHGGGSDVVPADKYVKVLRGRCLYYEKHWSPAAAWLGALLIDVAVLARFFATRFGPPSRHAKWSAIRESRTLWHVREPQREKAGSMLPDATAPPAKPLSVTPAVRIRPHPVETRARLAYRTARHIVRSVRSRDFDFVAQGLETGARLPALASVDLVGPVRHECNVCGWTGRAFYPNTGPGYHDRAVLCPGCISLDRHRSLLALLLSETRIFNGAQRVVEVAPMRGFEALMRSQPDMDYVSFDLERHAMERGDITAMRYDTDSVDYFLCFHVLEHIADDGAAVKEIHRVLRPGGTAVLQVPLDWHVEQTREYGAPDPREVGHVRRYGRDFSDRLAQVGLEVHHRSVLTVLPFDTVTWFGLSPEPVFFAIKPDCG
jgi:GT2 family glycosyltransferase/SAM-dependent methyltransferase